MNILLVVHDDASARHLLEAWKDMCLAAELTYIQDPIEARAFLDRTGSHEGRGRLDLVLLPDKLSQERARELYRIEAGSFISTPGDIGEFFRFIERKSAVIAHVLLLP